MLSAQHDDIDGKKKKKKRKKERKKKLPVKCLYFFLLVNITIPSQIKEASLH